MSIVALFKALTLIPVVVSGIERVFGKESSKTKLDSAIEMILPFLPGSAKDNQDMVDGIVLIINGTVKVLHAIGEFQHRGDS